MPNWEEYKQVLWELYVVEDKKVDDIVRSMRERFNFCATPDQYNRKFKAWSFRKNLKSQEWRAVNHRITKSKRARKAYNVYIDGILASKPRVDKETRRHDFPSLKERYGQAPSPTTPEGVYVCTPPAVTPNSYLFDNLPWFEFLRSIATRGNPFPDLAQIAANIPNISRGFVSCSGGSETLSIAQAVARTLSTNIHDSLRQELVQPCQIAVRRFHSNLRALLPEAPASDNPTMGNEICKIDNNSKEQYLTVLIYLLSNTFFSELGFSEFFQDIQKLVEPGTAQRFAREQSPATRAALEKLLSAAVRDGNTPLVELLLEAGVPAGVHVPGNFGRTITALQYATKQGFEDIVRVLLDKGADANGGSDWYEPSPLYYAVEDGNMTLVDLLLDHHADVNDSGSVGRYVGRNTVLQLAVRNGDVDMVKLLLNKGADINHLGGELWVTVLHTAAEVGNLELADILLKEGPK